MGLLDLDFPSALLQDVAWLLSIGALWEGRVGEDEAEFAKHLSYSRFGAARSRSFAGSQRRTMTWKRRRAEYLLSVGRFAEIRAEGLEHALGFQPGELEDAREMERLRLRKARTKTPRKKRKQIA